MKNQREIYEALLAGGALKVGNNKIYLDGGGFLTSEGADDFPSVFTPASKYEIYKEPKWYENIPDGGVLCWHERYGRKFIIHIVAYDKEQFISKHGGIYRTATLLTKQEIQIFMDNAPEKING